MTQSLHVEMPAPQPSQTIRLDSGHQRQACLTSLLREAGILLNTRCGERGLCDGCHIELLAGELIHRGNGQIVRSQGTAITLRGCEYRVGESETIRVNLPGRSLLTYEPQVVSDFKINVPWAIDPLEPAKPLVAPPLGVAIDIGTTTVAVLLADLTTGKIVGHATGFNRQMNMGDDVLTRINLCYTDKAMIHRLQHAIVADTLQRLLPKALRAAQAHEDQITCITVAGNTIMLHLLAGVDPSPMGIAPFTPPFLEHRVTNASSIHLQLNGSASLDPTVHLLPSGAAYVGADLTAGIFATGLAYDDGPSLLVDVGTNGEIILKHGKTLLGCATAAGPAFEGSRLASGMRAGHGAVSRIRIHKNPFTIETEVIGQTKPSGICGSAYVDFLAQARSAGLIGPTGRFDDQLAQDRMTTTKNGSRGFRIASGHGHAPILITESDVASLLQAKAAIAAGILTLLNKVGITPAEIKTLYLAGGFGMHIDVNNAIGCGLLPGFRREQVQVVGNTSLAGAYLSLLDSGVMNELKRIAQSLQAVELNLDPDFESRYIDQLQLDASFQ